MSCANDPPDTCLSMLTQGTGSPNVYQDPCASGPPVLGYRMLYVRNSGHSGTPCDSGMRTGRLGAHVALVELSRSGATGAAADVLIGPTN